MAELLIELLSEEIPARMQARASEDLLRLICDGLKGAGLTWGTARAFATPRRLALVVDGLPVSTPDRTEEVKGPRVGAPDQAIQGFLRKLGEGRTLADCETRSDGKSESWVFLRRIPGVATSAATATAIAAAVAQFPWPKSMRWAANRQPWVRPLHAIVAVLDGATITGEIDLGGDLKTYDPNFLDRPSHNHLVCIDCNCSICRYSTCVLRVSLCVLAFFLSRFFFYCNCRCAT